MTILLILCNSKLEVKMYRKAKRRDYQNIPRSRANSFKYF